MPAYLTTLWAQDKKIKGWLRFSIIENVSFFFRCALDCAFYPLSMLRSKYWKFIFILSTVQCEIYVHTSHIQGCKCVLIYFKVDLLRPSSQFPVDYTGFKTDRNKNRAKFQANFEVHWAAAETCCLPELDSNFWLNKKYSVSTQLYTWRFKG